MENLEVETIDLASIDGIEHEDRLQKMYEWRLANSTEKAKIIFGTALTSLTTLLFFYMKGDRIDLHPRLAIAVLGVIAACLLIGWFYYYRKVWKISRDFIEGLSLLKTALGSSPAFRRFLRALYS
jgi:hypothetical protein